MKAGEKITSAMVRTEENDGLVGKNPTLEFLFGRGSRDSERADGWVESLVVEGVGSGFRDGNGGDELEVGEEDWTRRDTQRRTRQFQDPFRLRLRFASASDELSDE